VQQAHLCISNGSKNAKIETNTNKFNEKRNAEKPPLFIHFALYTQFEKHFSNINEFRLSKKGECI